MSPFRTLGRGGEDVFCVTYTVHFIIFSHKQWRAQLKKAKRKEKRQALAQQRDAALASDITKEDSGK